MISLATNGPFDLAETLDSGQVFHFEPARSQGHDGFAGCVGDRPVWVGQMNDPGTVLTRKKDATLLSRYFRFDQPIDSVHDSFPDDDDVLREAIAHCPGLRIIRQPIWECLATFITSSLKQVVHIRQISLTLRRRFGIPHRVAGKTVFAYPTPSVIAEAGEKALRQCALGYRATGLFRTAEAIASGGADLADLESLDDRDARDYLMQFHGVGEKIANCVLLFGCGRLGAFPVDVWMDRILRDRYFGPRKRKRLTSRELQEWAEKHFGKQGGYAQQYLFHFVRKT